MNYIFAATQQTAKDFISTSGLPTEKCRILYNAQGLIGLRRATIYLVDDYSTSPFWQELSQELDWRAEASQLEIKVIDRSKENSD